MSTFGERLATVETQQETIKEDVRELKGDMKQVLGILSEAKGGWRTLTAVGAASAAIGSGLFALISWAMGFFHAGGIK